MTQADLKNALAKGDAAEVLNLIRAGGDIHYKWDHGYNALVDVVHGRDIARDPQLLTLLKLLIDQGVDLSAVTTYAESGLRVLSRIGRFDAVKLLLDAGADKNQLGWTPLIEAVALGSLADVERLIAGGAGLEETDWWSRTAWLVAILVGDIGKAKLIRDRGANPNACGRCGKPPLFHAIQTHRHEMLKWLSSEGANVHQRDEFGKTALMEAVEQDDLESVEILLGAGAEIHLDHNGTALRRAQSRAIITRLLEAGADPADANQRVILGLPISEVDQSPLLDAVSLDDFHKEALRSFGNENPKRMQQAFWIAMIRCGVSASTAREHFGVNINEPVWCASQFGQSLTFLPDGRAVQIGGEHEDYYDPDFCIYNDVFVHQPNGSIEIFGYPEADFPPTDFHTATLSGEFIYIIGSLGYQGSRRYGHTPVYRLNTRSWSIDCLNTSGDMPGWIFKHRASAVSQTAIRVWGGTRVGPGPKGESHNPNLETFELNLERLRWRRTG